MAYKLTKDIKGKLKHKTIFVFIGSSKQLRNAILHRHKDEFQTRKKALRNYGSMKEIYNIHGREYVHKIKLPKNYLTLPWKQY